jgi:hypothetical protein
MPCSPAARRAFLLGRREPGWDEARHLAHHARVTIERESGIPLAAAALQRAARGARERQRGEVRGFHRVHEPALREADGAHALLIPLGRARHEHGGGSRAEQFAGRVVARHADHQVGRGLARSSPLMKR